MQRTRLGLALATGVLGLAGLVGLAACGTANDGSGGATGSDSVEVSEALPAENQALAAIGFDPVALSTDLEGATVQDEPSGAASPAPAPASGSASAPASADGKRRHRPLRRIMVHRRNVEHGEFTVRTKDGDRTVAVQRGTVQSVNGSTLTVKSTDGFTQTWTLASDARIRNGGSKADASAIKVGATVGVGGRKDGSGYVARLVFLPKK